MDWKIHCAGDVGERVEEEEKNTDMKLGKSFEGIACILSQFERKFSLFRHVYRPIYMQILPFADPFFSHHPLMFVPVQVRLNEKFMWEDNGRCCCRCCHCWHRCTFWCLARQWNNLNGKSIEMRYSTLCYVNPCKKWKWNRKKKEKWVQQTNERTIERGSQQQQGTMIMEWVQRYVKIECLHSDWSKMNRFGDDRWMDGWIVERVDSYGINLNVWHFRHDP